MSVKARFLLRRNPLRRMTREVLASKLGVCYRTMSQELRSEGENFCSLIAEERLRRVAKMDHDDVDLTAKELGFDCRLAFRAWFKRHTGKTYNEWIGDDDEEDTDDCRTAA